MIFSLLLASAAQAAPSPLTRLVEAPSRQSLAAFAQWCRKDHPLRFHEPNNVESRALRAAATQGNPFLLRGLVLAYGKCADGASAESLRMSLGNELLLRQTAALVAALHAERAEALALELPEAESKEWFAVECDNDGCAHDRAAYFAKKREALRAARVKRAELSLKNKMLAALKSDRDD